MLCRLVALWIVVCLPKNVRSTFGARRCGSLLFMFFARFCFSSLLFPFSFLCFPFPFVRCFFLVFSFFDCLLLITIIIINIYYIISFVCVRAQGTRRKQGAKKRAAKKPPYNVIKKSNQIKCRSRCGLSSKRLQRWESMLGAPLPRQFRRL